MPDTLGAESVERDIAPVAEPMAETVVNVQSEQEKKERARNYSFKHKKNDTMDTAEKDGVSYPIPANVGSTYWAIIKVGYNHANERIYIDQLVKEVQEIMIDRDPDEWDKFCGRKEVRAHSKLTAASTTQDAKPWKERLINNAKTLTRIGGKSAYGLRLVERGHVLRFEYDEKDLPCFVLYTNLDVLSAPKKKKAKKTAEKVEDKPE